jgi:hypothetical protein
VKPVALVPREQLQRKPPHGDPCNRCGLCCLATLCPLGQRVFKQQSGPCPALTFDEAKQAHCGMAEEPQKFAPVTCFAHGLKAAREAALLLIGSGCGCDARFNGEPARQSFYAELLEWDHANRAAIRKAKRIWMP